MTTLIASYDGEGHCTGRCDANCYNAIKPNCHCICGGINHGAGLNKAIENTHAMIEELEKKWVQEHPSDKVDAPILINPQLEFDWGTL